MKNIGCCEDEYTCFVISPSDCDGFVSSINDAAVCKHEIRQTQECSNMEVIDEVKTRKLIRKNENISESSIRESIDVMISIGNEGYFTEHNILQLIIAGKIPHVKYEG